MWELDCNSGTQQLSTDLVTWTDIPSGSLPTPQSASSSPVVYEYTFTPPAGVKTYYRLRNASGQTSNEKVSALTPVNGAGLRNGTSSWDPDSPTWACWHDTVPTGAFLSVADSYSKCNSPVH